MQKKESRKEYTFSAMDSQNKTIKFTKKFLTTATTIAASAMLARAIVKEYLPYELHTFVSSGLGNLFSSFSTEHTIVIQETECLFTNKLYDTSSTYLRTRMTSSKCRFRASKNEYQNNITLSLDDGEELIDSFNDIQYRWKLISKQEAHVVSRNGLDISKPFKVCWYELSFDKKHKDITLHSYLPYILKRAADIKAADRKLNLYMNEYEGWETVDFNHPATFETLAMESELKKLIVEDLAIFLNRKDYYKTIGKAWKRGYLLFGPPGTGKSTLIAAIANYLRFDIYDLDLKEVHSNFDLKGLLFRITNKSLLVIEDIDCSIDLQNKDKEKENESNRNFEEEITLSGLLNIIDGLWSGSAEERIIVFTTNNKERFDPALLRHGIIDMQIHMGYCGPDIFRMLVSNYHTIDEHPMFEEIEGLLKEVEVTPAEIAEQLMRSDVVEVALNDLIELLKRKRDGEN